MYAIAFYNKTNLKGVSHMRFWFKNSFYKCSSHWIYVCAYKDVRGFDKKNGIIPRSGN
jgi:hypothetical protein